MFVDLKIQNEAMFTQFPYGNPEMMWYSTQLSVWCCLERGML